MDASKLLDGLSVVPVVVIEKLDHAVPLAECLLDAGLRAIEVTLRSEAGLTAIEMIAKSVPAMLVGAGSIRNVKQVAAVADAGARFGVSPGATDSVLNAARKVNLPFVPGAATASEMMRSLEHGYRLQKFFPAEVSGGVAFLKAVAAPIPEVTFMPTGGVTLENAPNYLALGNVAAIGGTWIAPSALLQSGDFESISRLAIEAGKLGA
jgi:2-dehydro-3-deoxyphosphogluconate aldolase/(4S)-4-hydroxy-2-oxoglutarate aldolase